MMWRIITSSLAVLTIVTSCTDATNPSDEARLELQTSMTESTVQGITAKGDGAERQGVDSVRIDSVRILFSRIKLHRADEDTSGEGRDVKTGPLVLTWNRGRYTTTTAVAVPTGRYERIKLEMHKFSGSEANRFRGDATFGDFVEPERVTVIVDGTVYADGATTPYRLVSDRTENLWLRAEPYFEITASTTTSMVVDFDAVDVFRAGGSLLDPRSPLARGILEGRLKTMLRLRRR